MLLLGYCRPDIYRFPDSRTVFWSNPGSREYLSRPCDIDPNFPGISLSISKHADESEKKTVKSGCYLTKEKTIPSLKVYPARDTQGQS